MSDRKFREEYRELMGMNIDEDQEYNGYEDELHTCCECGAEIDEFIVIPLEGEYYCSDCCPEL